MAWEQRGNNWYYYRKVRKGRQVVSEYIGTGEVAKLIHILDESDREEARMEQNKWKKMKEENQEVDMEIRKLNQTIRTLVMATLLVSGYHSHKGQWRKKRSVE